MDARLDAGSHAVVASMKTTVPALHRAYMVFLLRNYY